MPSGQRTNKTKIPKGKDKRRNLHGKNLEGKIHDNEAKQIIMEKIERGKKDQKFDIDVIFDHTFKKGQEVKIAPPSPKRPKEKIANSFTTRSQAGNSKTFYKLHRF